MRRILLLLLALVIGVPLVAVGGAFAWLQTESGQGRLAQLIEQAASSETTMVEIGALDGTVPFDMVLRDVTVADPEGVWLALDRARLAWTPAALLDRTARIEAIALGRVALERLPAGPDEPPPDPEPTEPAGLPSLPELPIAIEVAEVSIEELALAAPVLGQPARFAVDGRARLAAAADGASAALAVTGIGDTEAQAALGLDYGSGTDRLMIEVRASEPSGGLLATLLGRPSLPAVDLTLYGNGTLDDWDARLTASAGELVSLRAEATTAIDGDSRTVGMELLADVGTLLDPMLRPLVEDGIGLTVQAQLPANSVPTEAAIQLATLRLSTRAATLSVDGTIDLGPSVLDLAFALDLAAPAVFESLAPTAFWDRLGLTGEIVGPLTMPGLVARLEGSDLAYGDVALDQATLAVEAEPTASLDQPTAAVQVDLTGELAGLAVADGALAPLLQPVIGLDAEARVGLDGAIRVDGARIRLPPGSLGASATVAGWGASGTAEMVVDVPALAPLQPLAGVPLEGGVSLQADARWQEGEAQVMLEGSTAGLATGIAPLDALLGEIVTLAAKAETVPGGLAVEQLTLDAAHARLSAGVRVDDSLDATLSAAVPSLSVLEPSYTGAVRLEASAAGSREAPQITARLTVEDVAAAGLAIPGATALLSARDLVATPSGELEVDGEVNGQPVSATAAVAAQADGTLTVDPLRLSAAGLELAGTVTRGPEGTLTAEIAGAAEDLQGLGEIADLPLAGSLDLSADIAPVDGTQRVDLAVTGTRLSVAGAAEMARLRLTGEVADAFSAPTVDVTLQASGVEAAGRDLGTVEAMVTGGIDQASVRVTSGGEDLDLVLVADVGAADGATRLALDTLTVAAQDQRIALASPASIVAGPDGLRLDQLVLTSDGGRLVIDGTLGERYDLDVGIEDLPLALARLAEPTLLIDGTLDGSAEVAGTPADPSARLDLDIDGARLRGTAAAELPAIDGEISGRWDGRTLEADAGLALDGQPPLRLAASLPLVAAPESGIPSLQPDQPLRASIEGDLDLGLINPFLAASGDQVAGTLSADLTLAGPLDSLGGSGRISVDDGRYENVLYGISLTDIEAALTGTEQSLSLQRLAATTPGGGTIRGSGAIALEPEAGLPADLRLVMDDARLIELDLATVNVDSDLRLTGPVTVNPRLEGSVTINQAEIRVPDTLPPSIPTLAVTERNVPPELAEARQDATVPAGAEGEAEGEAEGAEAAPAEAFDLALDIGVSAPNQVFVRGRGLDVEVGGELDVAGSADAPVITGDLELVQGDLDLLSQVFTFERGRLAFTGGRQINPQLDFLATTPIPDGTARILVAGTVASPDIKIGSEPELPEDEVLSRLIFGRATEGLSPAEAIQLAQSAAELAGIGGGPGLLDRVRGGLGLDRLEIGTTAEGGTDVEAGRYISEKVFVGVEQGLEADSSRVKVEVEVLPNVTVESDVGADNTGRVGVNFEWDY